MLQLKSYLENLPKPSLDILFARNTAKHISNSTTNQSADINRIKIEYLSLLEIIIGSKELTIRSARLGDNIIMYTNQASSPLDRWGHSSQFFSIQSQKICYKMSVYFGQNMNEKIGINP